MSRTAPSSLASREETRRTKSRRGASAQFCLEAGLLSLKFERLLINERLRQLAEEQRDLVERLQINTANEVLRFE